MPVVSLDVVVVVVASTPDGDTIRIGLNAPSPFPQVPPVLEMKLKARTGVAWSRTVLGIDPKVIHVPDP